MLEFIHPDWPAPDPVKAVSTTRIGGVSQPPFDTLNLGAHCGDQSGAVADNRRRLRHAAALPSEPVWLRQVHGVEAVDAARVTAETQADASYCSRAGAVCAVLTADCLPILLCDRDGLNVAAVHAGWRGLLAGVIENTVQHMSVRADRLLAWMGPAIGPVAFEVGNEVREAFVARDHGAVDCFVPSPRGRWLADLYALARQRLTALGVEQVYGGDHCTYSDQRFFSYRRDQTCGRQATLIWLQVF